MLSDSLTFVCGIERVSLFMMRATGAGHGDSWRGEGYWGLARGTIGERGQGDWGPVWLTGDISLP